MFAYDAQTDYNENHEVRDKLCACDVNQNGAENQTVDENTSKKGHP